MEKGQKGNPEKRNSNGWTPQTKSLLTKLRKGGEQLGRIHVRIELMGKTEGHPMFKISITTRKDQHKSITVLMKRFKHFRALHNQIGKLSKLKRIYRNRFPDSHWQSHFGILGDEFLHERAEYLENWLNEVLCLSDREGWGIEICHELTAFLDPGNINELSAMSLSQHNSLSNHERSHHERDSDHSSNSLNETWPQLNRKLSMTPSINSPPSEANRSRADSSISKISSIFFKSALCPSSSSNSSFRELYETDSELMVTIYEGELLYYKAGVGGLVNRWRDGHWKLVWSDPSKSEAALLRYRTSIEPYVNEDDKDDNQLDGSGGSGGGGGRSQYQNPPRDVIPLRIVKTIDRVSEDHLTNVIGKHQDFGFGIGLVLVDDSLIILAAASDQDRQEWMGIMYSTLIRQVSNGQHDDSDLVGNVSRVSAAWETNKMPDEDDTQGVSQSISLDYGADLVYSSNHEKTSTMTQKQQLSAPLSPVVNIVDGGEEIQEKLIVEEYFCEQDNST